MSTPEFEVLASGFGLAEGPVAGPGGVLYVADTLLGGVRQLHADGGQRHLVPDRRGIGGLALHAGGGLLATGRDVALLDAALVDAALVDAGQPRPLLTDAAATGFNDLGVGPGGELLVGVLRYRPLRGEAPRPGAIWCIDANGGRTEFDAELNWPNGIAVSADGWVYAADFDSGTVLRGRWSTTSPPRLRPWWSSPSGQTDGLAIDEAGAVLVALGTGAGVARVQPDGTLDHVVEVPAAFVSSVCFAGEQLEDLIVTTANPTETGQAGGSVLRFPATVPGLPIPPVTVPTAPLSVA
ncbi:MAG TPA: SMP-30/gluconolactonase/LRE family protein [Pseudonocardia sp.]|nr:SMP-30/gluconolactonase/LRE family protein [Pseudonocardia sp.]